MLGKQFTLRTEPTPGHIWTSIVGRVHTVERLFYCNICGCA